MSNAPSRLALAALAVGVLVSRVPFLGVGYGRDPDAWMLAVAAEQLASGAGYMASRQPGHPVQELLLGLLHAGGPWAATAMSALFSVLAAVSTAVVAARVGCRRPIVCALALVGIPVVFVHSTTALDYVWALGLTMTALAAALERRAKLAGVLLGLATGCRLMSILALLPIGVLLAASEPRPRRVRSVAAFAAAALVATAIAFVPVVLRHGFGFLLEIGPLVYPPVWRLLDRATVGVWGAPGFVALLCALVALAIPAARARTAPDDGDDDGAERDVVVGARPFVLACAAGLVPVLALFLRYPFEPGYLVALLPFVVLPLGRFLRDGVFGAVAAVWIASSFVSLGVDGIEPGAVIADHARRVEDLGLVERVLAREDELPTPSMVLVGNHFGPVVVLGGEPRRGVRYLPCFTERAHFETAREAGLSVFFTENAAEVMRASFPGVDPLELGARPLFDEGE